MNHAVLTALVGKGASAKVVDFPDEAAIFEDLVGSSLQCAQQFSLKLEMKKRF